MHALPLLIQMIVALGAAFCGGMIARQFRQPPALGYHLAGVAIDPFTPGFIGAVETINQFVELGVIVLLFGVGLPFSLRDLWVGRKLAIPGALGQMAFATTAGFALTHLWGWSVACGIVLDAEPVRRVRDEREEDSPSEPSGIGASDDGCSCQQKPGVRSTKRRGE